MIPEDFSSDFANLRQSQTLTLHDSEFEFWNFRVFESDASFLSPFFFLPNVL